MHWIIIAIIVIMVVIGVLSWLKELLWDSGIIPFLLKLAACVAAVFAVYWLYSLAGCPSWLIGMLAVFLIVYNMISWFRYLGLKSRYGRILEDASVKSKEIAHVAEEFAELMKRKISDVINEAGMATDAEIFKKLELGINLADLNKKRDELNAKLKEFNTYGIVKEMKAIAKKNDEKKVFAEQLEVLLEQNEIKIQTQLNGDGKTAESWDNNLYCTTRPCIEGSNMLPPIHMEID